MRCLPLSQETHTTTPAPLEGARLSDVVHQLALDTLKELGTVLAIAVVTAPFMAAPVAWITVEISGCLTLSLLARILAGCFNLLGYERPRIFAMGLSSLAFLPVTWPLQVLIHEMGHVIAAHLLLGDAKTTILIHPVLGGNTSVQSTGLTLLGELLGAKWTQGLIAAAGPLCGLAVAAFMLHQVLQSPEWGLSESHQFWACLDHFKGMVIYALSAAFLPPDTPLGHDFFHLRSLGVNPLFLAALIWAVPLLIMKNTSPQSQRLA